jgi:hypothetical protein
MRTGGLWSEVRAADGEASFCHGHGLVELIGHVIKVGHLVQRPTQLQATGPMNVLLHPQRIAKQTFGPPMTAHLKRDSAQRAQKVAVQTNGAYREKHRQGFKDSKEAPSSPCSRRFIAFFLGIWAQVYACTRPRAARAACVSGRRELSNDLDKEIKSTL